MAAIDRLDEGFRSASASFTVSDPYAKGNAAERDAAERDADDLARQPATSYPKRPSPFAALEVDVAAMKADMAEVLAFIRRLGPLAERFL